MVLKINISKETHQQNLKAMPQNVIALLKIVSAENKSKGPFIKDVINQGGGAFFAKR